MEVSIYDEIIIDLENIRKESFSIAFNDVESLIENILAMWISNVRKDEFFNKNKRCVK